MKSTVLIRDFEERDIDFIHQCKNDAKLNEMIVGKYHPFSYEEAVRWVHGCMGEHENFKFWAVCTNDEEKRIIGWVSLSEIDIDNRSACHHGLVIGDASYRDGTGMFEAMLLSMEYAFEVLNIHRLYGSCFADHKISPYLLKSLGFINEGKRRDACYKNNRYYDILDFALLESDYYNYINDGTYKLPYLIKTFVKIIKNSK